MRLVRIILLSTLLIFGLKAVAQHLQKVDTVNKQVIPIENIGIDHGLSQGMINDIVEDSTGYLWVATKDGLNRYDGTSFKVFRHDPNDPSSISDNFVYSLLLDSRNRLWVGTQSSGVNLFDPSTESFIRFGEEHLSSNFIGELNMDHQGNIIVETLDQNGFQLLMMAENQDLFPRSVDVAVRTIREVYPVFNQMHRGPDHSKFIHFDLLGGLWYYNRDTVYYADSEILISGGQPYKFGGYLQKELFPRQASTFLENRKNEFYITDWVDKVYRFNYSTKEFSQVFQLPKGHFFFEEQLIDSKNRVWTIDRNGDIFRISLVNKSLETLAPTWSRLLTDVNDMHTGISLEDRNGNIWIGTGGMGLLKISGKADRFKVIPPAQGTIAAAVRMFRTEKDCGKGWYDPSGKIMAPILTDPQQTLGEKPDFLFSDSNTHLTLDSDGYYWTGGFDQQEEYLCKVDPINRTIEKVVTVSQDSVEWFCIPVFLDHDENVWYGEKYSNNGVNIYKYDKHSDSLTTYQFPIEKGKFKYRFISDWYLDESAGTMWLGTMAGVFSLQPESGTWKHFAADPTDQNKLSSDLVLSVCPDPTRGDSILWVGTEGAGLNMLNTLTGSVTRFEVTSGLPNNVVYGIQADKRGNLWLSSNYGLCLFNSKTFETQNFTTHDGLPHNEFNRYEFSMDKDGRLYFGSMGGVVHFNPEDFYVEGREHRAFITSLTLFDRPVNYGDTNSTYSLPKPIERCDKLTFDHDADMISFGFSLHDLTAPEKNKFRYQLEGLSDKWIEVNSTGKATFTDLAPGTYNLNVLGCGSDNVWGTVPTTLTISVLAPWYGTWWFRISMIAAFLFWTYRFYRYRLSQMLRMERMRNRIAQDLHDDIGSTLSSISLYSSVLKQKMEGADQKSITLLDRITTSSSEMMESMNDMVWTIKADNDLFEHVINRMRAFAVNLCETKGVALHFKESDKVSRLKIGMDTRKNIYLIYKEAVNNSIKYSEAKNLWVNIDDDAGKLRLVVKDDGVGFDQGRAKNDTSNLGGNGLKGMNRRAAEIGADLQIESENGVRIQLTLTL